MIQNNSQLRHLVIDPNSGLQQGDILVCGLQHQVVLRHQLEALDELWVVDLLDQVIAPEITIANAAK